MSEPDELSRLRDNFAAAALTGLLVNANSDIDEETMDTPSDIAYTAYAMADAMLRERANHIADAGKMVEKPTNHDAAPAARASEATASPERVRVRGDAGTGDTQEPVAWIVRTDHFQCGVAEHYETAVRWAEQTAGYIVPLYRQPQPCPYVTGKTTRYCTLTPFTLTDAEREAINDAIYLCGATDGMADEQDNATAWATCAATLRGLLERLK